MKPVSLACPHCEQSVLPAAAACPGCGLTLADLDKQFGEDCVVLDRVTDAAHVLRLSEKDAVMDAVEQFERAFPQLFLALYLGNLPAGISPKAFGFWLLNRAAVTAVDFLRPNENGSLVIVDVQARTLVVTLGYYLESVVAEKELTRLLRRATALLRNQEIGGGLVRLVHDFSKLLERKAQRRENRKRFSPSVFGEVEMLPRLNGQRRRASDFGSPTRDERQP
ncbi:MAG: TPM domain-containing protein [Verrucomicrobiales bacterium]